MKAQATITYRDVARTESLDSEIRERIGWLEERCPRLVGCHVMVERPHRSRHRHRLAHVRIDVTVPGAEIVIDRDPPERQEHEHVAAAVRDAFQIALRKVCDHQQRKRKLRRSS